MRTRPCGAASNRSAASAAMSRQRFARRKNCCPRRAPEMDSLVREVREVREAYAKQFGYDLEAIHRDLKEQERASGRKIVALAPRRPQSFVPGGASHLSGRR